MAPPSQSATNTTNATIGGMSRRRRAPQGPVPRGMPPVEARRLATDVVTSPLPELGLPRGREAFQQRAAAAAKRSPSESVTSRVAQKR